MKYVYAVLTVLENKPIMQTLVSPTQLTGRDILDKVILTEDERRKYRDWLDENKILKDLLRSRKWKYKWPVLTSHK